MNELYIVMYHYVRRLKGSAYPGIKGLETELFEKQIAFIKKKMVPVTMEEVMNAVHGGKELPSKAVLLTFDDGYSDHYTNVFPVLQRENIQGSFFISGKPIAEDKLLEVNKLHFIRSCAGEEELFQELCGQLDFYRGREFEIPSTKELFEEYGVPNRYDTKEVVFVKKLLQTVLEPELRKKVVDFLFQKYVGVPEQRLAKELYLSETEIKKMKKAGMHIGCHGYNHEWLGNLSKEEAADDIDKALEVLEPYIDTEHWVMNYPYGSYNETVIKLIKERGCCLGVGIVPRAAILGEDAPYELPRVDTNDLPPKGKLLEEV